MESLRSEAEIWHNVKNRNKKERKKERNEKMGNEVIY